MITKAIQLHMVTIDAMKLLRKAGLSMHGIKKAIFFACIQLQYSKSKLSDYLHANNSRNDFHRGHSSPYSTTEFACHVNAGIA